MIKIDVKSYVDAEYEKLKSYVETLSKEEVEMLEFARGLIEIIIKLRLSEKKQTIKAEANCSYRTIERFIDLYDGDVACAYGNLIDNYDLEFEDGTTILFREFPKTEWGSIYKIYLSNDTNFIEKNKLVYNERRDEYVLQGSN